MAVGGRVRGVFLISRPVCGGRSMRLGVLNAALERAEPWPAKERRDGRTAFRGSGCEVCHEVSILIHCTAQRADRWHGGSAY
jgi:hypothetical protein